ncbi:glycosyltransferase family 87 protein [Algisphaera agarilytica]|uniref:DUF2029 domain-containing protein n=1 Tax=Algisphaera agarilytica TaxID=1385975 RepID=A0A7X0HAH5_9BACT|nr:glycosyltransferase family 87 protein [Algisphaera agarilytica]MBB6430794.1 hypothetical protein [Algisphaera agarilytica]
MASNQDPQTDRPSARPRRGWMALSIVVLIIGAGMFTTRGVMRGLEGSWDFTMLYAGALRLVEGQDPYLFEETYDAFREAGGTGRERDPVKFNLLYPPFTYALLSPLGMLQWSAAKTIWVGCNLLATAAVAVWLVRHRPRRGADAEDSASPEPWWPAVMAVGLWLACSALHTSVAFGQLSVVPLALMLPVLAPWRGRGELGQWPWMSLKTAGLGLMLAVGGAIKPQLVVVLAMLLLATPRWRVALWSLGWAIGIAVVSMVWIQTGSPDWLQHWRDQLTFFTQSGQALPTTENPLTYQMINLEPWLHRLWLDGAGPIHVLGKVVLLAAAVCGAACVWKLSSTAPQKTRDSSSSKNRWETDDFLLLALSLGVALTLLVDYHRTYDAVLLVLPALWVWRRLAVCRKDLWAWVMVVCMATFMVPGPSMLVTFARKGMIPTGLTESWLWQAWLLPHHNVALLVLAVALGVRLFRRTPLPRG